MHPAFPSVIYGVGSGMVIFSLVSFFTFPVIGYVFTFTGEAVSGRFSGVMSHPQTLSCLIAMILPLFIFKFCTANGFQRYWGLCLYFSSIGLMYITSSRGGMLAGIVSSLTILFLFISQAKMPYSRQRAITLLIMLFLSGIIASIIASEVLYEFIIKNEGGNEINLSGRSDIIERSWAGFLAKPIFGNGFQVPSPFTEHGTANFGVQGDYTVEKSFFLTMMLEETGIVGTLLFLSGLVCIVYKAFVHRYFTFIACIFGFLTVNLSEAVIFSPSALGGLCWLICFSTLRLRS